MAGNTGKRAKPPANCSICGKHINGDYLRVAKGDDRHIECQYPHGPNGPTYAEIAVRRSTLGNHTYLQKELN
jgi:hypothetical protein